MPKTAVVIGAGPAGLTAALELLRRTDIAPIVLEASHELGGISRTVRFKGNRMDLGGHRFFSKSDRVMQWWADLMPPEIAGMPIQHQGQQRIVEVPAHLPQEPPLRGMGPLQSVYDEQEDAPIAAPVVAHPAESNDRVMLVRPRKSRIYYLRKFFDYPISLSANTIRNLGLVRITRIAASYAYSRIRPIHREKSLEDFLINRFGRELYRTFFKSYTEKVWGVPCETISAAWGAQRIKGLSLTAAVRHLFTKLFRRDTKDVAQKSTETSLIERFLYPKLGPGQLWELVAEKVIAGSGEIHMGAHVAALKTDGPHIVAAIYRNESGDEQRVPGDTFLSTMPMRELVLALEAGGATVPDNVRAVALGLQYRDFITVGVLANKLTVQSRSGGLIEDTWIYIQEPDVLLGRLQVFNNWSPYLVADPSKVWLGLEYFCYDTDALWSMTDAELRDFAVRELETLGILRANDVLDAHIVRVPKAYPAYFGTYDRFDELRAWVDSFENLYLIGRNGMHKYNNQDHSMLTAMEVVDGMAVGLVDKRAVWAVNTGMEYHESK
jgi:protoporphyrinogen oxidase